MSSEHDSVLRLAWAVQREGEKPAGGRAVMATTESRGVLGAEILPPCQRDTGQLCLTEVFRSGEGSGLQLMAGDTGKAFFCELAVLRFELDAEVTAVEEGGRDEGAA
jgi:hypothetical protein